MKRTKKALIFFCLILFSFAYFGQASAVCPLCTVVVAGGLGLSEWLGIDDFVSALWIGGLMLSVTAWCWNYLKKKGKLNKWTGIAAFIFVYGSTIYPIWALGSLFIPGNTLWGIDKLVIGMIFGTVLFWISTFLNASLKKRNEGKVYFPFQKVALPFGILLASSLIYYLFCNCFSS